ncbi:sulfatase [Myxococcota bacterium]|nr:sulfatase [Myxococcota bacterium]
MLQRLSPIASALAPTAVGVTLVALLDALTLLSRGAPPRALLYAALITAPLALLAAALLWGVLWISLASSRQLARALRRAPPPPERLVAALAGLLIALALHPAHQTFAKHALGAYITTGYALFVSLSLSAWLARLWRRAPDLSPRWLRALALVAAQGLIAVHQINTQLYAGLYTPLHHGLTGLSVGLGVTAALLLLRARPRLAPHLLAGVLALGLIGLGALYDAAAARAHVFFSGTELQHLAALVDRALDWDRDGVSGALGGGDCRDDDPQISPLRYEIKGNDVDENCRGGAWDGQRGLALRPAPLTPGVAAWRAARGPLNVVVVFIDTLRADAVGAYGATEGVTPHLDAFLATAARFTQARTTAPRTPHAWMSIIRARFNGRNLTCRQALRSPGARALPHVLQRAGYFTAAHLVGQSWPKFHLKGGWDRLMMKGHANNITGGIITRDALATLKAHDFAHKPLFLVAHYADPHAPYLAHGAPGRGLAARYRGEVAYADAQLGQLLAALKAQGRLDDTIIIVFSDHGENLGDHGDAGGHHGVSLYDEVLRVPLGVYAPGVAPRVVEAPVSVVDIAPTILELVGARPLKGADGRSLAGYLFDAPPPPAPTISEFYDFDHRLQAIVDGRHKLILDARHNARLLFDVIADPQERKDLLTQAPEVARRLNALLDRWVDERSDPTQPRPRECLD